MPFLQKLRGRAADEARMRATWWSSLSIALLLASSCTGFREVVPGVYRSPQPGEDQLARRIARYDIQCVVCLRGGASADASERAALGQNVTFHNVPLSAMRRPRPEALLELWRIAREAPRPLLLHCRAGADRTGLAAALLVLHDTGDLDAARGELAMLPHGHLGAFGTEAMDEVLDGYEPHAASLTFPQWVETVYAPEFEAARGQAVELHDDPQRPR